MTANAQPSEPQGQTPSTTDKDTRPVLAFWYEFASTYSYLSAMRIESLASDAGVRLLWRPFILGPLFKKQGWNTSPFNLYPAKGRYMWMDMERQCQRYQLPLTVPEPFPQNTLLAARVATIARDTDWIGAFTRAVFNAEFGEGRDISDETLIAAILLEVGAPAKDALEAAKGPEAKDALRSAVSQAEEIGIFGAPSFVPGDGELYWGDDRLHQALEAAAL